MLIAEPLWIFGSVGFCIACGRKQLSKVENFWMNEYLLVLMVKIVCFFIPIEIWVLYLHTDWETTFLIDKGSDWLPLLIALAIFIHLTSAMLAYWLNMHILRKHGYSYVAKLSLFGFGLFFSSQGIFYDTLMYSGSYDDFHTGVQKSFVSFLTTDRFRDAYIMFFVCFGPIFFFIALSWNETCSKDEKKQFSQLLWREALMQGIIFCLVYTIGVFALGAGSMNPCRYTVLRLPVIILMYFVPILILILPFQLLAC